MITRTARPGMPLVLVVEDLQAADTATTDLLSRLVGSNADTAIFIISTGHGSYSDSNPLVWRTIEPWWQERVDRLGVNLPTPLSFSPKSILEKIGIQDREAMVAHWLPYASPAAQRQIAETYENPLALETFCTLKMTQRQYSTSGTQASAAVSELPRSISELYVAAWYELPEEVRHAYFLAAITVPSYRSEKALHSAWSSRLVEGAAQRSGHDRVSPDILRAIRVSTTAFGWCRDAGAPLREFFEETFAAVAASEDSILSRAEVDQFLGSLQNEVEEACFELGDEVSMERLQLSWTAIALRDIDVLPDDQVFVKAILPLFGALKAYPREDLNRIVLGEWALGSLKVSSRESMALRGNLADAYQKVGRLDEAIAAYSLLHKDNLELLGADDDDTLITLNNLATSLEDAWYLDEAIELYIDAIEHRGQRYGPHSPKTVLARNNLGSAYKTAGRVQEAIDEFEQIALIQEDESHPKSDRFGVQANLVAAYVQSGQFSLAVAKGLQVLEEFRAEARNSGGVLSALLSSISDGFKGLKDFVSAWDYMFSSLEVRESQAGVNHPDTIETLISLATVARAMNNDEASVDLLEQARARVPEMSGVHLEKVFRVERLLAEAALKAHRDGGLVGPITVTIDAATSALGPKHPETIRLRITKARANLAEHAFGAAIVELNSLLDEMTDEVPGSQESRVAIKESLALAHSRSGDVVSAIALLEDLLGEAEQSGNLALTAHLRNEVGANYAIQGRPEKAVPHLSAAVEFNTETLESSHPSTIASRTNLGRALRDAGDLQAAADVLMQLLQECIETQGRDSLATANILHSLGSILVRGHQESSGLLMLAESVNSVEKLYGEKHFLTILFKNELAGALILVGDFALANEQLVELRLVADAALPSKHPERLSIENNLFLTEIKLGRGHLIRGELDDLVDFRKSNLGANHQNTLTSWSLLANLMYEEGEVEESLAEFRRIVAEASKAFGATAPLTLHFKQNLEHVLRSLG
ncbi:tetratricopeptide repeat protein [Rathayibacter oskolensis]|uniref:tetratricopeptide repeat protein n=1 Tax=Rathayibacter oskolensis TaxID=1891671 RepID=UPI00265F98B1|nr:tetratricopeptide repeat protein [Rathayibacter oskolensis]WKK72355.1 tetratricopeptide repeat protein [Rathayibacter oskolensis]